MFVHASHRFAPVAPAGYGYGQNWHHPAFYPGYYGNGYVGHYPGYHYGQEQQQWQHGYEQPQYEALAEPKPAQKKNVHDYHTQHGYAFGQGSGQFPDYYNHNY
ncbi:hypothetical protein N0O92_16695 [Alkalihalobacillus sp. MEB130]|uniref:hypothetical protein n=1 Tax=Alkalihalobacillus sp. MEB130 TaxID=2976704 RepID=UPI0028DDD5A2|nr:hypothetical protein [Alkalihalobacillus sp. MEB130]MDT8861854.1 hypothetical protein [Alkalihalobacillus sp. MEB130]